MAKPFRAYQVRRPSSKVTGAERNFLKFCNIGIFPYVIITAVMKVGKMVFLSQHTNLGDLYPRSRSPGQGEVMEDTITGILSDTMTTTVMQR